MAQLTAQQRQARLRKKANAALGLSILANVLILVLVFGGF